jgi:cation diffusion facilitator CzcD-associated flavoprotein CzcO
MPDRAAPVTSLEHHQSHVDVLIIGAGLSGIAAGAHLRASCPGKSYAILEARASIGGTWDLFRYPGIRSDSDMFTLGYGFRPWKAAKAIADGPSILEYVKDTAREHGIDRHIRFGHRVVRAEWSSAEQRWSVEAQHADSGQIVRLTAGFLFACTGYYRYDEGYTPKLPGIERFGGRIVHPQQWPEELDYAGKRVVVIGSGATAVTLAPALATDAAHVTMLQRSPSYIVSLPGEDPLAKRVRRVLPERLAHTALRWKNLLLMMGSYQLSRRAPKLMRRLIRSGVEKALPPGYDVDTHFNPSYDPWDQRLCLVPDGDLFEAIGSGRVSVVTDSVKSFTEAGVELESGQALDADIVITATGLNLLALGGMELRVDGRDVELSRTLTYRGLMLGGVPNMAMTFGYTNASWTLKCELICRYVTRLLNHMDARGCTQATPRPPAGTTTGATEPFLNLTSGYVRRSVDHFPRQGASLPWRVHQNYLRDIALIRRGDLEEAMEFASGAVAAVPAEPVAA